jgi:Bifunctional DNA primase/polymerase, N-terminal
MSLRSEYEKLGLSLVPLGERKLPTINLKRLPRLQKGESFSWLPLQKQPLTREEWRHVVRGLPKPLRIGVVFQADPSLFVLDFDYPDLYSHWASQHPQLARTATVATGIKGANEKRGRHCWFRIENPPEWRPNGKSFKVNGLKAGEIKGFGGLIVVPPSVHSTGVSYEWLAPLSEALSVPSIWSLGVQIDVKIAPMPGVPRPVRLQGDGFDLRDWAQAIGAKTSAGWYLAKCPIHNGNSDDSLHISVESGAFKCHAGCESREVYKEVCRLVGREVAHV